LGAGSDMQPYLAGKEMQMPQDSLRDLYIEELRDLYDAEQQIIQALPKMAQTASSQELKTAFQQHLEQTRGQVDRLEQIFRKLNTNPQGKKCVGVQGVIREGEQLIKQGGDPETLDAGLIGAAQKVEHYEIAGYGTVRTWARRLGDQEAAQLLQQTLDEEGETDKKLTRLAEAGINQEAAQPGRQAA
jgi:ferritin-like metal-binding protein YciE